MISLNSSYLLGVLALSFASVANAQEQKVAEVVPGAYIVEFAESSINTPAFYQNLTDSNIEATPRETLAYELFNGASFQLGEALDNKTTIETIQSMGIVSKIWPVRLIDRPARTSQDFEFSVGSKANIALRKRAETDEFSTHVMTGVNKLHAEGYLGDGLYIGVIDSGVDYNHPALGGGFGPEYKVVAGYDLVGDEYTGGNTPVPDDDPMDCGGHGTHVSGIIAADDNPFNFTGVVPQAKLGVWKVFGCDGPVSNDILIRAFNMAYEAGVDMISASIGGPSGWTEEPWDVAVQRITEKGVPCILSAGNDGSNGLFYTSTASESIGTTSVGSIDNTIQLDSSTYEGDFSVDNGTSSTFAYAPGTYGDFGSTTAPLYAVTLDNTITSDACSPLPDSTPDLSSYVVLIRRGTCTFDVKVSNVVAFNATKVMFYNNAAGIAIAPGSNNPDIPAGMVSADQGASWISTLKTGSAVTVSLKPLAESEAIFISAPNTATGGKMRTSSSWGPSYELWLKPEVAAPGGLILSTVPLAQGGYGVKSGTSMAAPFISGVIGLIKQIRGKDTFSPDALTSLLASTAVPVDFNDGVTTYPYLAPVAQQGGGLVDAYEAVYTNSLLNVDNIALNDTTFFVPSHPVTISNIGDDEQTYTFSNILAATAYTFTNTLTPASFPPELTADIASGATIEFDPAVLTIAAKSQGTVNMIFTPPTGLDASRLPVYGGFVAINGSSGDTLSLPYAGVAARMRDVQVINSDYGYPFFSSSNALNVPITTSNMTFSLPGPNSTATPSPGEPSISLLLAMGTRLMHADVMAVDARGGKTLIGSVPGWPIEYSYRNGGHFANWSGQLASGEWASSGLYTLRLRVLKILGDETLQTDYEVFESPFFTIKYI